MFFSIIRWQKNPIKILNLSLSCREVWLYWENSVFLRSGASNLQYILDHSGIDVQSPFCSCSAYSTEFGFSFNADLWFWSCWLIRSNIYSVFLLDISFTLTVICNLKVNAFVTAFPFCHLTNKITSLYVLEKEIMSVFCMWCFPGKFHLDFFSSDRKFLHFFLFLPSPANSNVCISIASFLLHLPILSSFSFFIANLDF